MAKKKNVIEKPVNEPVKSPDDLEEPDSPVPPAPENKDWEESEKVQESKVTEVDHLKYVLKHFKELNVKQPNDHNALTVHYLGLALREQMRLAEKRKS